MLWADEDFHVIGITMFFFVDSKRIEYNIPYILKYIHIHVDTLVLP